MTPREITEARKRLGLDRNPSGVPLSGKVFRPTLPARKGAAEAARVAGRKIRRAFCPPKGVCRVAVPPIRTGAQRARPAPQTEAPTKIHAIYDAEGRRYSYEVAVLPLASVVASHTDVGAADPRARPEFQARTFSVRRAEAIAKDLDPDRLAPEGPTPTIGAPVVWLDAKTGLYHALAGNHRLVGMRLSGRFGKTAAFRVLVGSLEEAKRFAAASQRSDAAPETLLERARASTRSLDLTMDDLPRDLGAAPITRDNVADFLAKNKAFAAKLLRPGEEIAPEDAAARVNAALVGLLPTGAQEVLTVVGEKAEQAIAAGAPTLLYLHREARAGRALPVFDLFESFDRAARLFRRFSGRAKTAKQIVEDLERSAMTPTFAGFEKEAASEIDARDVGLILGLASLERRANPAEAMAEAFAALRALATENDPRQARLFGGAPEVSQTDVVRVLFGAAIAKQAAKFDVATASKNPPRRAGQKRAPCRCGTIACAGLSRNPPGALRKTSASPTKKYADDVEREFRKITGESPWPHGHRYTTNFDNHVSLYHAYGATAIDAARLLVTALGRHDWVLAQSPNDSLRARAVEYKEWRRAIETVVSRAYPSYTSRADLRKFVAREYKDGMAWYAREKVRKAAEQAAEEARWQAAVAVQAAEAAASVAARKKAAEESEATEKAARAAERAADQARRERLKDEPHRLSPEDLADAIDDPVAQAARDAEFLADIAKRFSTLDTNPSAKKPHCSNCGSTAGPFSTHGSGPTKVLLCTTDARACIRRGDERRAKRTKKNPPVTKRDVAYARGKFRRYAAGQECPFCGAGAEAVRRERGGGRTCLECLGTWTKAEMAGVEKNPSPPTRSISSSAARAGGRRRTRALAAR